MPTFGRLLTAMATPMHADGSLNLDGAQRLAVHLVEHGNDGVVVAGTTGESPTLTHGETLDLFSAVTEAVGDRASVVAGVGKNDTAATVTLAREAAQRGVDGIMLVTPYYNRPSQRGLVHHFSTAAAAVDLPVILYDIPGRTSCEIAQETLIHLAETVPNIVGVKDAVKDLAKTAWVASRAPDSFDIWSGDDVTALPVLAVGGVGLVSVAAHLVGDDLARMFEIFPTDPAEARRIHLRLLPLFQALFVDSSPAPLKAALKSRGLPSGPVRPPLAEVEQSTVQAVEAALQAAGVVGAGA